MPGKLQKTIKCDRIKENLWLFESSPCRVRKMRRLYRKRNLPTGTEWRSLPKKPSQQGIPSVDSFLRLSRARQSAVKRASHACMNDTFDWKSIWRVATSRWSEAESRWPAFKNVWFLDFVWSFECTKDILKEAKEIFLDSSMVERTAVNRDVVGSSYSGSFFKYKAPWSSG